MKVRTESMRGNRQTPMFAFPPCLKFFLGTKSSHIQVLTLYNPYDFPIKYKVHCHSSAWEKYIVPNPEGVIPNQSSIDLVVTHKQAVPHNCNLTDKLKVIMQDTETDEVLGKKTVDAILLPGVKSSQETLGDEIVSETSEGGPRRSRPSELVKRAPPPAPNSNFLFGVIIAACAIVLLLPTEVQVRPPSTTLPDYLHMAHNVQLFAALLLGVFLCILVRQ